MDNVEISKRLKDMENDIKSSIDKLKLPLDLSIHHLRRIDITALFAEEYMSDFANKDTPEEPRRHIIDCFLEHYNNVVNHYRLLEVKESWNSLMGEEGKDIDGPSE